MSSNNGLQIYKDDDGPSFCNITRKDVNDLTDAIQDLKKSIDQLWFHVVRWLLIVVCAIALGKELLAVIKGIAAHG